MSQHVPPGPYIYQLEPASSPIAPRLYAVSGPGTECHEGKRYTKEEAERIVEDTKNRLALKLLDMIFHEAVEELTDEVSE